MNWHLEAWACSTPGRVDQCKANEPVCFGDTGFFQSSKEWRAALHSSKTKPNPASPTPSSTVAMS